MILTRDVMGAWGIATSSARAILGLIALVAHVDTCKVECWHAWWRRLCTKLGTQTHRPNFMDICARAMTSRQCARDAYSGPLRTTTAEATVGAHGGMLDSGQVAGDEVEAGGSRRRGGGGAWRAFVYEKFRQGRSDLAAIATAYRSRSEQEVQDCLRIGHAATQLHRIGQPAFWRSPTKNRAREHCQGGRAVPPQEP